MAGPGQGAQALWWRSLAWWPGLLGLALAIGCGGSEPPSVPLQNLMSLVQGLPDAMATAESFASVFAPGAVPPEADRQRISLMTFEVVGEPTLRPDGADVQVRVYDQDGKVLGEATWNFVLVENIWRCVNIPLPASPSN